MKLAFPKFIFFKLFYKKKKKKKKEEKDPQTKVEL